MAPASEFKRAIVLVLIVWSLIGCGNGCTEYDDFFTDRNEYEALVRWADTQVFSRTFSDKSYRMGGISWPGMVRFSNDDYGVTLPRWAADQRYEVRPLDKQEAAHPKAIFIGKFNSTGIIIFKNGPDDINENDSFIKLNQLTRRKGRIALVCARPSAWF